MAEIKLSNIISHRTKFLKLPDRTPTPQKSHIKKSTEQTTEAAIPCLRNDQF